MKRLIAAAALSCAVMPLYVLGQTAPTRTVVTNAGTWSTTAKYAVSDTVSYNGSTYISLIAANVGVTPGTDATKWASFGAAAVTQSGTAGVSSFASRTGAVTPQASDYSGTYTTPAQAAAAAPVQSVNGQTGAVTVAGTAPITGGNCATATQLVSGITATTGVPNCRSIVPADLPTGIPVAKVTGLANSATVDTTVATNITTGLLPLAQVPTLPVSKISGLANSATTDTTNASNIITGTLPLAQLPTGIPNADLANAKVTINGQAIALGGSATIATQSAVTSVNGKGPGPVVLTPFDVGAVNGPGAGSSSWASVAATCGASCDTYQTYSAYELPTASSALQLSFCNAYTLNETAGPDMTIKASIEYPVDSGNFRSFFFGGSRTGNLAAGACLTSEALQVDILPSTSKVVYVRMLAQRLPTSTAAFPGFGIFGYVSGSAALAPYTTSTVGNRWNGMEALGTYTATSGLTATCTAGSTAVTFGANLIGTTAGAYGQYVGQAVSIAGAGASSGTLSTTIATMTSQTAGTLATACTTAASAAVTTITPVDKTLGGTIFNVQGGVTGFAPFALIAKPTGTVKTVGIVGDSISYGQGANQAVGSWAVQALNQAGVAAGLSTAIATAIPYVNASQSGELACNLSAPLTHTDRFSLLSRVKYVLGMLGTNDMSHSTAPQLEACFVNLWQEETQRGTTPFYATIIPKTSSSDSWATVANQSYTVATSPAFEAVRIAANDWLRDGAPYDCSTAAPATTGSTSATVVRASYTNASGVGSASTVATVGGACTHPMGAGGTFELANYLEINSSGVQAQDGGYWMLTTGSGTTSTTTGQFTADGTHPSVRGHYVMGTAAATEVVNNLTF